MLTYYTHNYDIHTSNKLVKIVLRDHSHITSARFYRCFTPTLPSVSKFTHSFSVEITLASANSNPLTPP